MSTFVLATSNAGPSNNLRPVGQMLAKGGHTVMPLLGGGKPLTITKAEIDAALNGADVVLLGLSSNEADATAELQFARAARERGIPYGFYLNIPLEWRRPWLGETATHAAFLVGVLPDHQDDLREKFPKARFFRTGSPERGMLAFPKYTRKHIRQTLGLSDEVILTLAPGRKEREGNLMVWKELVRAVQVLGERGKHFVIMLSQHPGEPEKEDARLRVYNPFILKARQMGVRIYWLPSMLRTPDAIPGADLVVEFDGGASVIAAYLRVMLLKFTSEALFTQFEEEVLSRELETLVNGAGLPCEIGDPKLPETLLEASKRNAPLAKGIRRMQERAYPTPEDPEVFTMNVVRALEEMAPSR